MNAIALLFPGQGSQAVGMGAAAAASPAGTALFARASDVLGFDLARLCREGPEEELTKSDCAQPAIFTVSTAVLEAVRAARPDLPVAAAAGLSSGEWAALYAAGVLSFEDVLRVLQARGRFMQDACELNPGGMVSVIGLDDAAVADIAARSGAEIANFNSPGQTVLSGTLEAVEAAGNLAREAGARMAVRLNVAGAFHSSLMQPAADRLAEVLAGVRFAEPAFPVLSNVTGLPHEEADRIPERMVGQVTGSVRWVDDMRWMVGRGVTVALECGPGKVLAGLMKRIDKQCAVHNIPDLPALEGALDQLG